MEYVYVLKSLKDGKHYMGFTDNVSGRLQRHNAGLVRSTKSRRPFILIYVESFCNRVNAAKREKFLKSAAGRKELRHILRQQR